MQDLSGTSYHALLLISLRVWFAYLGRSSSRSCRFSYCALGTKKWPCVVQGAQYNGLLVPSRLAENYIFLDRKYAVQYNTQFSILVYSVPATSTIVSSAMYHYICGITTQFVALWWL